MFIDQHRGFARKLLECPGEGLHACKQLLIPRIKALVFFGLCAVLSLKLFQLAMDLSTRFHTSGGYRAKH